MKAQEGVFLIFSFTFLFLWIILFFHFSLKKLEFSNSKIGFYFTIFLKIITNLFIYSYYHGANPTELIGGFLFNFDWLLIPILSLLSAVIRRIKYGKKTPLNGNNLIKNNISESNNYQPKETFEIDTEESKTEEIKFDLLAIIRQDKFIYIGTAIIFLLSVFYGIFFGKKEQQTKLSTDNNEKILSRNIQESIFLVDNFPLGFEEISCEEGLNNETIVTTLFNQELENATLVFSKCFSKILENDISLISEVILYPLTQEEIRTFKLPYEGDGLHLYLNKNPEILLIEGYQEFGDFSIGFEMSKIEDEIPIHYQIVSIIKNDFLILLYKISINNNEIVDLKGLISETLENINTFY